MLYECYGIKIPRAVTAIITSCSKYYDHDTN